MEVCNIVQEAVTITIPKKKKCKKAKWLSELREDEKRNAKEKGKDTHLNAEYQRTARLQQYVNRELPDVQAGFRKGRGTRDQIANIRWIIEKAREFQKNISASLTMPKPLTVWITINCGEFFKRWEYQTT